MNEQKPLISINEIFREAWRLYAERFPVFIGIAAIPNLLFFFAEISIAAGGAFGNIIGVLLTAAGIAFSLAATLALVHAIKYGTGIILSYRNSAAHMFAYLWMSILDGLIVFGGFLMAFVPAFVFSIWFLFGVYVLVLENQKGFRALLASKEYVRGYWGPVFLRIVPFVVLVVAASATVAFLSASFSYPIISLALNLLLAIIIVPFSVAYEYVIYTGLKSIRTEVAETPVAARRFLIFSAGLGALAVAVLIFFALPT